MGFKHKHTTAETYLSTHDPLLGQHIASILKTHPPLRIEPSLISDFAYLVRSIVYQQLSGKAAHTIHQQLSQGLHHHVTAHEINKHTIQSLRAFGLSTQKATYLLALAKAVDKKQLILPIGGTNETIIKTLTAQYGIGLWTAQMFLLFHRRRPNILPTTDLGIRRGVAMIYGYTTLPTPSDIEIIGQPWHPYQSIASLYLWKTL